MYMGIGLAILLFLTCGSEIIILQKLNVNHKIYAEEAKIADGRKVLLDCCWA